MWNNLSNFFLCRISDFKLWYLREIIKSNVHSYHTVMDIGSGNTRTNIVEWTELYRVDPIITPIGDLDIVGTWEDAIPVMKQKNIDCVFLMDVIEHLPKRQGEDLLAQTRPLVKQIVVFTPLGFMLQEDGEWNTHRSGWQPSDFGEGWRTWILKDFHTVDFKGNKLITPVSAIVAIYK